MGDPLLASEVGAHLTAALLQWTDLWGTDLGFSLFGITGVIEPSGSITPTLTWTPWDYVQLETSATWSFGSNYTPFGQSADFVWEISLSLGSGKF
jgi:hypothetical protein